jgi:hypothetical protein
LKNRRADFINGLLPPACDEAWAFNCFCLILSSNCCAVVLIGSPKKKEGKKEMFRPGLDGEETLSSIMQKYQQHQKFIEHLKTSKDGESEMVEMQIDTAPVNGTPAEVKIPAVEDKEVVEPGKEEPKEEEVVENKAEIKKRSRFADMTEQDMAPVSRVSRSFRSPRSLSFPWGWRSSSMFRFGLFLMFGTWRSLGFKIFVIVFSSFRRFSSARLFVLLFGTYR